MISKRNSTFQMTSTRKFISFPPSTFMKVHKYPFIFLLTVLRLKEVWSGTLKIQTGNVFLKVNEILKYSKINSTVCVTMIKISVQYFYIFTKILNLILLIRTVLRFWTAVFNFENTYIETGRCLRLPMWLLLCINRHQDWGCKILPRK